MHTKGERRKTQSLKSCSSHADNIVGENFVPATEGVGVVLARETALYSRMKPNIGRLESDVNVSEMALEFETMTRGVSDLMSPLRRSSRYFLPAVSARVI